MAAQGDVVETYSVYRSVCLLTGVTAINSPPSGNAAGVVCNGADMFPASQVDSGTNYFRRPAMESVIMAKGVGSGGTVTMTLRLWGYNASLAQWVPIGTGADSTKGILNAGAAIGEVKQDTALHCEPFYLAGCFERLYVEVTAIGGTSTAVEVWLVTPRINTHQ